MYCILVTGIPAAGKSTMAKVLSKRLKLRENNSSILIFEKSVVSTLICLPSTKKASNPLCSIPENSLQTIKMVIKN